MARYNSVNSTGSVAGGNSISTPYSGLLTTLTGSGGVTVPNPVYFTGQTQTYYNSTGNVLTLSTPSGVFNGPGTGASSALNLPAGSIITLISDGTNYLTQDWLGGAVVTTSITASSGTLNNVNIGASTPGTGAFTTLSANNTTTLAGGSASGIFNFTSNQASSATNNGAIVVTGGAGIGGALFVGGVVSLQTASPSAYAVMDGSGAQSAIVFPTGTTAQRPGTLISTTAKAGMARFNTNNNYLEYYDGTNWNSISAPPTISSISPTNFNTVGATITINGSLFSSTATVTLVDKLNTVITVPSVTFVSSTQITFLIPSAAGTDGKDPFNVVVTNPSGLSATLAAALTWNATPSFTSGALNLNVYDSTRSGYSYPAITATSPDPGATITFAVTSGSLPSGLTLNSNGTFSGTANAVGSNTTSTFNVTATATSYAGNTYTTVSSLNSITVYAPQVISFTSTGGSTFNVPVGISSVQVLVIGGGGGGGGATGFEAGGGGGAGGFVSNASYPVTPGGSVPVTIGAGGAHTPNGGGPSGPGIYYPGSQGGNSAFGSITAYGGGHGGGQYWWGAPGASGGGMAGNSYGGPGSTAYPAQGNNGGSSSGSANSGSTGAGGGGAGGAGSNSTSSGVPGGPGVSSSITGSPVFYAGGEAGGNSQSGTPGGGSSPGGGGAYNSNGGTNLGGGGGGTTGGTAGNGGPGIVIVRY